MKPLEALKKICRNGADVIECQSEGERAAQHHSIKETGMGDIIHSVGIEAPEVIIAITPVKVFKAITEQHGLEAWWTTDVIAAKPEVGCVNLTDERRMR